MELTTVASWMFSESVLTITSVNTEFTRYVLLMMTTTEWWILDFSFFFFGFPVYFPVMWCIDWNITTWNWHIVTIGTLKLAIIIVILKLTIIIVIPKVVIIIVILKVAITIVILKLAKIIVFFKLPIIIVILKLIFFKSDLWNNLIYGITKLFEFDMDKASKPVVLQMDIKLQNLRLCYVTHWK